MFPWYYINDVCSSLQFFNYNMFIYLWGSDKYVSQNTASFDLFLLIFLGKISILWYDDLQFVIYSFACYGEVGFCD